MRRNPALVSRRGCDIGARHKENFFEPNASVETPNRAPESCRPDLAAPGRYRPAGAMARAVLTDGSSQESLESAAQALLCGHTDQPIVRLLLYHQADATRATNFRSNGDVLSFFQTRSNGRMRSMSTIGTRTTP